MISNGSPLLSLPREIRDIINTIITFHPTPTFTPTGADYYVNYGCGSINELQLPLSKCYIAPWYLSNPNPLLRVNRQLRRETLAILHGPDKKRVFAFDMCVRRSALHVTWMTAPDETATELERVYASIRVARPDFDAHWLSFIDGTSRIVPVPPLEQSLLSILWVFLQHSPGAISPQSHNRSRDISIKTLELDVQTASLEQDVDLVGLLGPSTVASPWRKRHPSRIRAALRGLRKRTTNDYLIMHPDYLVKHLRTNIERLTHPYHHLIETTFFKQVGRIRLLLNGDLMHELDLRQLMESKFRSACGPSSRLCRWNSCEIHRLPVEHVKDKIYRTRAKLGLDDWGKNSENNTGKEKDVNHHQKCEEYWLSDGGAAMLFGNEGSA